MYLHALIFEFAPAAVQQEQSNPASLQIKPPCNALFGLPDISPYSVTSSAGAKLFDSEIEQFAAPSLQLSQGLTLFKIDSTLPVSLGERVSMKRVLSKFTILVLASFLA